MTIFLRLPDWTFTLRITSVLVCAHYYLINIMMNRFLIFLTTYWSFMADNKYDKKKITHKYLIENIFQEIHVHVLQHFCIYFTYW
jgi:hypothetical protein